MMASEALPYGGPAPSWTAPARDPGRKRGPQGFRVNGAETLILHNVDHGVPASGHPGVKGSRDGEGRDHGRSGPRRTAADTTRVREPLSGDLSAAEAQIGTQACDNRGGAEGQASSGLKVSG